MDRFENNDDVIRVYTIGMIGVDKRLLDNAILVDHKCCRDRQFVGSVSPIDASQIFITLLQRCNMLFGKAEDNSIFLCNGAAYITQDRKLQRVTFRERQRAIGELWRDSN